MRRDATLLLLGALLCVPSWGQLGDRTDGYLLESAAPPRVAGLDRRPNVLFVIADDLNVALGSYLGSAPHPHYRTATTPNLDRLAAEGIRFERAYVQNPLCNPSRTSLLSGLRPPATDVYDGGTPPRHRIGEALRMLPEHFADHGYFTARVGKIAHNRFEHAVAWDVSKFALSREPAYGSTCRVICRGRPAEEHDNTWVEGSESGMSRAEVLAAVGRSAGLPLSWRATRESPRMTPDGTTATRIVQLMAENRDRPFFIAAGFHKPHQPWVAPRRSSRYIRWTRSSCPRRHRATPATCPSLRSSITPTTRRTPSARKSRRSPPTTHGHDGRLLRRRAARGPRAARPLATPPSWSSPATTASS